MIEAKSRSRCILVLGMHRSGTSAATRCLNLAGMDLGSHLLVPDKGNSKGYWEHADAVRINDTLLQSLGLHWWSPGPLPEGWRQSDAARVAAADIEKFVKRDFSGVPLWGVKDPRMCLLAPLWIDVLTAMGMDVSAVFVFRRALEVARSLSKAQELAVDAGVLSWIQYTVESERATRAIPRTLASYDQVLADPVGTLERAGRELGIDWPIPPRQRREALTSFVDAGLRSPHHSAGPMQMPAQVLWLESVCEAVGEGRKGWDEFAAVSDEISSALALAEYRVRARFPDEWNLQRQIDQLEKLTASASLTRADATGRESVVSHSVRFGRSRLEFPVSGEGQGGYRLCPGDRAGYYVIHELAIVDGAGTVRWSWNGGASDVEVSGLEAVDSPTVKQGTLCRTDDHPQVVLSWPLGLIGTGYVFVLDIERFDEHRLRHELDVLRNVAKAKEQELLIKLGAAADLRSDIDGIAKRTDKLGETVGDAQVGLEQLRIQQVRLAEATATMLQRGVVAWLRRRFARTEFGMRPTTHLKLINASERHYLVTGNDPAFECETVNFPLMPGWYRLELEMPQLAGAPAQASLYPDYGAHVATDPAGISLPFVRAGRSRHVGVVRFAHALRALRFDPAMAPCEIKMSRMLVRRVSKVRAAWELFRAWRQPEEVLGKPRPAWRSLVRDFIEHGASHAFGNLYSWYTTGGAATETYATWLASFDDQAPNTLAAAKELAASYAYQPLISVLVPTYNTEEKWLRKCLDSVLAQAYARWELCVADDASPDPRVMAVLNEYMAKDERVRVERREENGHIAASSNTALRMARGEFIALLDHDDELHPLALQEVVSALQNHRECKLIYTDEDKIDIHGVRYDPYMKPDWNYDLLLSQNCVSHFGVYQRELVNEVGGFRQGYEGSQDWDLALRIIERLAPSEIGHIPRVLYHWRAIPGSTAVAVDEKSYARLAGRKAIQDHLQRVKVQAEVLEVEGRPGHFRVRYLLPPAQPRVSLIVPTRDGLHLLSQCVDSILSRTTYENYEIVIVDNQSAEQVTHDYFDEISRHPKVTVLRYDEPFNYSALNNFAASQTSGDLLGLINNDIEVITPDWLEEMVGHAVRPDVGAVGAMLYYPDNTIQHAGVVLGVHGVAAHSYCGEPRGFPGQMGRARLTQELSAVTAACLIVRRAVFEAVGGLDETLQVAFNDIDFCLRVRSKGYRNIWTPFAELYHHESATRGQEDSPEKQRRFTGEVDLMQSRWAERLAEDPFYSPNLTLVGTPYDLAFPPRDQALRGG